MSAKEATIEKPSSAVAVPRSQGDIVAADAASIMEVIDRAARDPNTDVGKLERLVSLYERVKANSAKAAFDNALAQMQPKLPVIAERGKINIGSGKPQGYALWEDINEAIKPFLAEHGFTISFRTGFEDEKVVVTCVLSRDGHREETTMKLPVDTSGSKNTVQAFGSSTSYGKRYTAMALLNLTSRGEDDDGKAGGASEPISEKQMAELQTLINELGADKIKFLAYMKVESLSELPAKRFKDAKAALEAKRAKK